MHILQLALRQFWRDLRSPDVRMLALAVFVAVAAVSSVGFMSDRVGRALERDAARMLGADLVIETPQQVNDSWLDQARLQGLNVARSWQFPSMVGKATGDLQLASIKAVDQEYPLRGELRTALNVTSPDEPTREGPQPGSVWVDPQLLALAGLKVGDILQVGRLPLKIDRIITYEPDRGAQFVNVAPRVLIRSEDLAQTELIGPGSRVNHALLVAGTTDKINAYKTWLEPQLLGSQRILTVESGRPEVGRAIERAEQFLTLVVMIAVLIAAVAVALGARRFSQRQLPAVAVIRCLGATQTMVTKILIIEFLLLGIVATAFGLIVGLISQHGLVLAMAGFLGENLPLPGMVPAWQGLYAGLWLLFAFSLPPLQALSRVPPGQVLRQQVDTFPLQSVAGYLVALIGFGVLMWWVAGNLKYGFGLALGFATAAFSFGLISMVMLWVVNRLRSVIPNMPTLRFALAGLVRRRGATIAQTSALAVGMMAILLLTIVRTDLIDGWQRTLSPDTPNRFLINIQPDQRAPIKQALLQAGLPPLDFSPMVRGRLIEQNGRALSVENFDEPRAQRLLQRDFNLSYSDTLQGQGAVTEGREFDLNANEVSMEVGLADLLRLKLGDDLVFEVAGQPIKVKLTSLRQVNWDTMRANFFAITTPKTLENQPQTLITAFHLQDNQGQILQDLIHSYPNLTIFNVGTILAQLQSVLDRVSVAVQGLFLFAVAAGALVLAAALIASKDERIKEAALLRALGATQQQLRRAQSIEMILIGILAGLMSAAGAVLVAWGLVHWVFEFEMKWSVWPWLLGIAVCIPASLLTGKLVLSSVLYTPPWVVLRQN